MQYFGENSETKILQSFGISKPSDIEWILSRLTLENVRLRDLKDLSRFYDTRIQMLIKANKMPPSIHLYDTLNAALTAVNRFTVQSQFSYEEEIVYRSNPKWLDLAKKKKERNVEVLEKIFKMGVKSQNAAYWAKKQHITKRGQILEPLEDVVALVLRFETDETRRKIKKYKEAKFAKDISQYKSIGELNRTLTQLYPPRLAGTFEDHVDIIWEDDNWIMLFPRSIAGSMMCDPNDITTWCTVRKSGGNTFLNYVGEKYEDSCLYYVISKDTKRYRDPSRGWFSLGYINGSLAFQGMGGISVDGRNKGLNESRLVSEFGESFVPIVYVGQQHSEQIGSNHPAKLDLAEAAQNVVFLRSMYDKSQIHERIDFAEKMIEYGPLSVAVQRLILTTSYFADSEMQGYYLACELLSKDNVDPNVFEEVLYSNAMLKLRGKNDVSGGTFNYGVTLEQRAFSSLGSSLSLPDHLRPLFLQESKLQVGFANRQDLSMVEMQTLWQAGLSELNEGIIQNIKYNLPKNPKKRKQAIRPLIQWWETREVRGVTRFLDLTITSLFKLLLEFYPFDQLNYQKILNHKRFIPVLASILDEDEYYFAFVDFYLAKVSKNLKYTRKATRTASRKWKQWNNWERDFELLCFSKERFFYVVDAFSQYPELDREFALFLQNTDLPPEILPYLFSIPETTIYALVNLGENDEDPFDEYFGKYKHVVYEMAKTSKSPSVRMAVANLSELTFFTSDLSVSDLVEIGENDPRLGRELIDEYLDELQEDNGIVTLENILPFLQSPADLMIWVLVKGRYAQDVHDYILKFGTHIQVHHLIENTWNTPEQTKTLKKRRTQIRQEKR